MSALRLVRKNNKYYLANIWLSDGKLECWRKAEVPETLNELRQFYLGLKVAMRSTIFRDEEFEIPQGEK